MRQRRQDRQLVLHLPMSCRRKACPPGQSRPSWIKKKTFEKLGSVGDWVGVRAAARCLIVAIAMSSWFAISNHCAISAVTTKTKTAQSECPFHSKPEKPQPKPAATECCKILRAIAITPAKNVAPAVVDFSFGEFVVLAPRKISFAQAALDTGPPGKTLLAQLSRSLRAHAPPFRA